MMMGQAVHPGRWAPLTARPYRDARSFPNADSHEGLDGMRSLPHPPAWSEEVPRPQALNSPMREFFNAALIVRQIACPAQQEGRLRDDQGSRSKPYNGHGRQLQALRSTNVERGAEVFSTGVKTD